MKAENGSVAPTMIFYSTRTWTQTEQAQIRQLAQDMGIEEAKVEELFEKPLHPYTQALMNSVPALGHELERLQAIPGSVPNLGQFPSGCRFHPRCRFAVKACAESMPSLTARAADRSVRCFRADEIAAGAK